MNATIAVLAGDGIGPEVTQAAVAVLQAVADRYAHKFRFVEAAIGGAAIDKTGSPLPEATLAACQDADAVLLGAVGGPKWADMPTGKRPEDGLLKLRKSLGLFANIRPVKTMSALAHASPLKQHLLDGVDFVVVRELTGGIYFGEKKRDANSAYDACTYTREEIERVARKGFAMARARRKHVTSVDKANVLETSRLWREIVTKIGKEEFPDIKLDHMLVDAAAMHLVRAPAQFDVILTENMFGDILTDEAAAIAGSIGMLPSASLRDDRFGLYEPIHGSAPDIAGKGIANPYGAIASAAMLLHDSLGLPIETQDLQRAIDRAVLAGVRTPDITRQGVAASRSADVARVIVHQIVRADPVTGKPELPPVM